MKFSMKWLEQELETNASPREIADKLTMIGLELENLDDPADRLKEFVVAHVEKAENIPMRTVCKFAKSTMVERLLK